MGWCMHSWLYSIGDTLQGRGRSNNTSWYVYLRTQQFRSMYAYIPGLSEYRTYRYTLTLAHKPVHLCINSSLLNTATDDIILSSIIAYSQISYIYTKLITYRSIVYIPVWVPGLKRISLFWPEFKIVHAQYDRIYVLLYTSYTIQVYILGPSQKSKQEMSRLGI